MLPPMGSRARQAISSAGYVLLALAVVIFLAPAASAWPGAAVVSRAVLVFAAATAPPAEPIASPAPRDTFFDKPITFGDEPTTKPTAAPTPFVRPQRRGARVTLGLNGNVNAGEVLANGTRSGSTSVTSNTFGLQASLERRSDASDLRMSVPGALTTHGATVGNASIAYVSRRGVLNYGYFALGPLGTLPFATIDRAYSLTTRLPRGGEFVAFAGSPQLVGDRAFHTLGFRVRRGLAGGGVVTAQAFDASATTGGGGLQAFIAGVASRPGRLSGTAEFGFEQLHGLGDVGDGSAFAYQLRGDYTPKVADFALSRRVVTDRFVGTGAAGGRPEILTQLGALSTIRGSDVTLQTSFDTLLESPTQGASYDIRHGASIARRIGVAVASLAFADDRSINAGGTNWNGSGAQNFAIPLRGAEIIETLQATRTTASATGPSASITYGLDVLKSTTKLGLEARLSQTNQTGSGQSGRITSGMFGISRSTGTYVVGLVDALTHTQAAASDQVTNATTFSLGRRVFGSVFLQAQYGLQTTRSRTAPQNNGTNAVLNFSLGAPFALGNANGGGRADPRAPATISGVVINDGIDPLSAGTLGVGVADIAVTLDGSETQRTDVLGRFQFRFVSPGRHEVRIEPAALPRGFSADYPFLTLSVAGGQTAQVSLGVSARFGALSGKITGIESSGAETPIANASIRLDGLRVTQSGPLGNFGFGQLIPGPHTVEVVDSSLPAEVQLTEHVQKVTAAAGTTATLVFRSAPLGSIGGRLVAQNAGKDVPDGPIANAYVVANPGERAAITSEDGTFTIDNLPTGTYTISVDPETLPQDTDATEGAKQIELHAGEHIEGVFFTIGEKLRGIDFTFSAASKSEKVPLLSLSILTPHLAPGGSSPVNARSSGGESELMLHAFRTDFSLVRAPGSDIYRGRLIVPLGEKNGPSIVSLAGAHAKNASATATVEVDSRAPLIRIESDPRRPMIGQYVRVRLRSYAEVAPGDQIVWQDGSTTKLGAIQRGRIFTFTQKIGALPYHGILRTKTLPIPITLGM